MKVSAVGFGAWAIGGGAHGNSYGSTDDAESVRAVQRAVDLGCTFFDTADVYGWGHSEKVLGEALEGRREDVVLATKVGGDFYHGGVQLNFKPEYVRFAVQKSLERLRTDYLDLYQLHNPPAEAIGDPGLYRVMEELKEEGRIREYGVSIHAPQEGLAVLGAAEPGALQVVYNLVHRDAEERLFAAARGQGVGIVAREPLWNGFLTGKYRGDESFEEADIRSGWPPDYRMQRAELAQAFVSQLGRDDRSLAQAAISFAVARNEVSTVIPGCKTVAQVEENMAAAEMPWTSQDDEALVRAMTAQPA